MKIFLFIIYEKKKKLLKGKKRIVKEKACKKRYFTLFPIIFVFL